MHSKTCILFALLFLSLSSSAQDRIYPRKRGVIEAKIMEVTRSRIVYRLASDSAGRDYVIDWDDAHKIEYADGKVAFKEQRSRPDHAPKVYTGANIVSMAILAISSEGLGFGIAYERKLDKEAFFALFLPVNVAFAAPGNPGATDQQSHGSNRAILQVSPALKLYPTRNTGKVRFAVGPQLAWEKGRKYVEREMQTNTGEPYYVEEQKTVDKLGLMVNSSLVLQPSEKVYMGADVGLGATIINKLDGAPNGARQLTQFNFRIGYRF